jgi:hypothetical protein
VSVLSEDRNASPAANVKNARMVNWISKFKN